jgi:hypothetical protein
MREQDGALMNIGGRLAFLDLLLEMEQNGSINETDIQHEVNFLVNLPKTYSSSD